MHKLKLFIGMSICMILWVSHLFAQDDAKLVAVNYEPGTNSLYRLSFTAFDTLAVTAVFQIVMPSQFDISGVHIAGSSTVNGGFSVATSRDTVRISRSGLGREILPGELIEINFAVVKNPDDMTGEYSANVTVSASPSALRRNFFTARISSAIP